MANMSDLDTTGIGIIAFWNALDHWVGSGTNEIDPTDCIGVFDSYDVYDNGIEGYKALGSGRYFHARVKSDGWMVAWIDRTNTFFYPTKPLSDFGESGRKGYYDILWDWAEDAANISSTQTTLSYLISLLYNALSNKTDFSYASADVGHYCYEFPDANVMTLIGNSCECTGTIQYTNGTILHYAVCAGSGWGYSDDHAVVKFAGNTLLDTGPGSMCGVADILAENWMPNPLTPYDLYIERGVRAAGAILVFWS